jgi:hypothetical protein
MNPFLLQPYIPGAAEGELTGEDGLQFAFTHRRKTPVVLEIAAGSAGVIILNGTPIDVFGRTGYRRLFSSKVDENFKAGGNRFEIVPLEHVSDEAVEMKVQLFEVVEEIVSADAWRIRRWETTPDPRIGEWVPMMAAPMEVPRVDGPPGVLRRSNFRSPPTLFSARARSSYSCSMKPVPILPE